MVQVLYTIKMRGGAQVELLATPALFAMAKKRGLDIEADTQNSAEVLSAFTKLIYLSALNAWEVRKFDNPTIGDFKYTLMDFMEWGSNDAEEFVKAVNFVLAALTHKELKDYATEQTKGSEKAENEESKEVKKKSRSGWITRLLRRS